MVDAHAGIHIELSQLIVGFRVGLMGAGTFTSVQAGSLVLGLMPMMLGRKDARTESSDADDAE